MRAPESLRIEIGILRHADECLFRFGRRADAPIGFLVDVEPDETLCPRRCHLELAAGCFWNHSRRMLTSHERSLATARIHSGPAGQIAAREMEIVRIKGAIAESGGIER